jgi:hypothetical protein
MSLHTHPRTEERYADCVSLCSGIAAAAFGGVALVAVLFLGEGVPRVQNDVLKVTLPSGAEVEIAVNNISEASCRRCLLAQQEAHPRVRQRMSLSSHGCRYACPLLTGFCLAFLNHRYDCGAVVGVHLSVLLYA